MLFYKAEDLKADGYDSFIKLVQKEVNNWNGIIWPILGAFFYCFLFPWFRNRIIAVQARWQAEGSRMKLKYSEGGKVPIENYLVLKKDLKDHISQLEEATKEEIATRLEIKKYKDDIKKLDDTNSEYVKTWTDFRQDIFLLKGLWEFKFLDGEKLIEKSDWILDGSSAIRKTDSAHFGVSYFLFNPISNEICMFFKSNTENVESMFFILEVKRKFDKLSGTINSKQKINAFKKGIMTSFSD